ncbi:unnamed protein product [Psylliodes chrysocephalus]|uniref:Uncharacterized protein n=1 Tax=Psylliodes chrysocephalus TaxID=3402493 RepID=A0A9P0DB00_9CUCU|nr:unnamed protein product [Psylliodes chrysocephala]
MTNTCANCKQSIKDDADFVQCDSCDKPFYNDRHCYITTTTTEYRAVLVHKQRAVIFFCNHCKCVIKQAPILLKKISILENQLEALAMEINSLKGNIRGLENDKRNLTELQQRVQDLLFKLSSRDVAPVEAVGDIYSVLDEVSNREIRKI